MKPKALRTADLCRLRVDLGLEDVWQQIRKFHFQVSSQEKRGWSMTGRGPHPLLACCCSVRQWGSLTGQTLAAHLQPRPLPGTAQLWRTARPCMAHPAADHHTLVLIPTQVRARGMLEAGVYGLFVVWSFGGCKQQLWGTDHRFWIQTVSVWAITLPGSSFMNLSKSPSLSGPYFHKSPGKESCPRTGVLLRAATTVGDNESSISRPAPDR